jgi:hypothetical protein
MLLPYDCHGRLREAYASLQSRHKVIPPPSRRRLLQLSDQTSVMCRIRLRFKNMFRRWILHSTSSAPSLSRSFSCDLETPAASSSCIVHTRWQARTFFEYRSSSREYRALTLLSSDLSAASLLPSSALMRDSVMRVKGFSGRMGSLGHSEAMRW